MTDPLVESKTAEAANAAANALQAENEAIQAIHTQLVRALREALTDSDPTNRPLLIARIPAICNDIVWIKRLLWAVLGGIGGLAMLYLTNPH